MLDGFQIDFPNSLRFTKNPRQCGSSHERKGDVATFPNLEAHIDPGVFARFSVGFFVLTPRWVGFCFP